MNLLFAAANPLEDLRLDTPKMSPELFWLLVAVGVIAVAVIIWACFFHRKDEDKTGWGPARSHYRPPSTPDPEQNQSGSRRRRRRRRRDHRPRNPTLAETGGLPPARPDQASDGEG